MKKRSITGHRIGEWHGKTKHSDETVRQARELRDQGLSYGQIAKRTGVNARTVADWINYATRYDIA